MSKDYNLFSNSDMRRFQKDLKEHCYSQVEDALQRDTYEVNCPHCKAPVNIPTGQSTCPQCKEIIELTLDINL